MLLWNFWNSLLLNVKSHHAFLRFSKQKIDCVQYCISFFLAENKNLLYKPLQRY